MSHDPDNTPVDEPLDASIKAAIDSVAPPRAEPSFWSELDRRLDEVDQTERDPVLPDPPGHVAPVETLVTTGDHADVSIIRTGGRRRFLAAAAAIVVVAIGLALALAQGNVGTNEPAEPQPTQPAELVAETMAIKVDGEPEPGAWSIWRGGFVEDQVVFPADGTYEFIVVAKGRFALGGEFGPDLELQVDSVTVGEVQPVQLDRFVEYRFATEVTAGPHSVAAVNARLSTPTRPDDPDVGSPLLIVDRIRIEPLG